MILGSLNKITACMCICTSSSTCFLSAKHLKRRKQWRHDSISTSRQWDKTKDASFCFAQHCWLILHRLLPVDLFWLIVLFSVFKSSCSDILKLFKVGSTPRLILVSLLIGNVMNSRGWLEIGWKANEPVITSFVFVGLRSIRKHFLLI